MIAFRWIARALFLLFLNMPINLLATTQNYSHLPSPAQEKKMFEWNRLHSTREIFDDFSSNSSWPVLRPFSEMENTAYVAISGENAFELANLRLAIAKNLPPNVSLIIYVQEKSMVADLKEIYRPYLEESRLKFLYVPSAGNPIWARDSLPFPVYLKPSQGNTLPTIGLVDSYYPQEFEPDEIIAQAFSQQIVKTKQYFRGGNLLFDLQGNCFAEYAREVIPMQNPNQFFTKFFGCNSVTILPQEGGIGDVDERIKFLADGIALTDNHNYAGTLKSKGYKVVLLPTTGQYYETYMNTLYVNGTIFVPQMGLPSDAQALTVYRSLGMNAVGIYTKDMADNGNGNIHCVTMNYPASTFQEVANEPDFVEFVR